MEQRTDAWFKYRAGKVTASRVKDVRATIKTGEAADRKNYRAQLVVERLTGTVAESFSNAAMQWGTDQEPNARQAYEFITGNVVEEIGFIDHPTIKMAGMSPDGLIGDDGLVEIKCPNTATHIDWLLAGVVPKQHVDQIMWQMICSGRKWCDFVSYDPRLPLELQLFIKRLEFNQDLADQICVDVIKFIQEVDATVGQLKEWGENHG